MDPALHLCATYVLKMVAGNVLFGGIESNSSGQFSTCFLVEIGWEVKRGVGRLL